MKQMKKGSLTIILSLSMITFLTFCLILIEGARIYYLRVKAEQAMELAGFSALSEYQQELFEHYGAFFLDLDYEQGLENVGILEERTEEYLEKNAEELTTKVLKTSNFRRATDGGGMPFFRQATEQMKVNSGYQLLEKLQGKAIESVGSDINLNEILSENKNMAAEILEKYVDEDGHSLFQISLPSISFPTIDALTEAVFGSTEGLSDKEINLDDRLLMRNLKKGIGITENVTFSEMQLFHTYLFAHMNYYTAQNTGVLRETLEYQMEYIISGQKSDRKNLENIMWRIFLSRTGGNYLFYHQDEEKVIKAGTEAQALVGITGNAVLINLVQEILLISSAIEAGIIETKQIFAGNKVPLYEDGFFSELELGYEEYLYLFLNNTEQIKKIYRCMDVVELEVRKQSGCETICLDHCVDALELQWSYLFKSLFTGNSFLNNGMYENRIIKKVFYEM